MEKEYKYCEERVLASRYSSLKLLLFMLPLIVVAGFAAILGSSTTSSSIWDFRTRYPWLWRVQANSSLNTTTVIAHAKESEHMLVDNLVVSGSTNTENQESSFSDHEFVLDPSSSSPPQAVEASQFDALGANEMKQQDGSRPNTIAAAPTTESTQLDLDVARKSIGQDQRVEHTNLERLEAGLQKVRVAIKEAKYGNQTHDLDYVPVGPMYWNAKIFHRSYLEMEKQFKVFVYKEGEPPVFHNGPCKSIYSMEGNFIHRMEVDGQFRTKDPDKAHVYFLPFSVAMMVQYVYVRNSHDFGPIRRTVSDYVNLVSSKYIYWNRSHGADHFMLACHDWGPEASFSIPNLGQNAIRALCNANTSEKFNPMKDVSFPEINLQTGSIKGLVGGPSPSRRSILAFFAGGVHGPIRPIVLEHWEDKDVDIKVYRYLPKGVSYYEMMRRSKFCLCPSGYEVASPRIVEALYTGCVPVLISDHYVPPFSDVLNWKSFSVEVAVRDIPNLKKILMSISPRQYIRMQRRVGVVRKHFEVNSPPKRFDVFHMILHSIWLRRLNVRINS